MLANYIAAALRNLVRNKLYAAINIFGLSVSFTAAILIALFVRDEYSYDKWIPDHERVYLLATHIAGIRPGDRTFDSDGSQAEVGAWLKLDFPEIQSLARIASARAAFRRRDVEGTDRAFWADPELFDVLKLPVVAGDLEHALYDPDGVVLPREMAVRYFGRPDPIGETLEVDRSFLLTVRAVIADLPSNTHLVPMAFLSGLNARSLLKKWDGEPPPLAKGNDTEGVTTYLKLKPSASAGALRAALPEFMKRHAPLAESVTHRLTPIADIHFSPLAIGSFKPRGVRDDIYSIAAIGLLLLVVATVTYVNLMTARAARRSTEVGLRKVAGARRGQVTVQFLGESYIYVWLSACMALALAGIFMPAFNAFLDRKIHYAPWTDPPLLGGGLAVAMLVGFLAGIYPALALSRFHPGKTLKGDAGAASGSALVRQGLVVLQFSALITLLVSADIIYRQTNFALRSGMRSPVDQTLLVIEGCKGSVPELVRALPKVKGAACASYTAFSLGGARRGTTMVAPNGERASIAYASVDPGLLELSGFRPVVGRFFTRDRADTLVMDENKILHHGPIVINETAVQRLGLGSPEAAVGQILDVNGWRAEVIGVAPDFQVNSIEEAIEGTAYFVLPEEFDLLAVSMAGADVPEVMDDVKRVWKTAGPPQPIQHVFLDQYMQFVYIAIIRQGLMLAGFALITVIVAASSLFGLSAFTAEQRTKEIGIRKTMGAETSHVLRLLVWRLVKPVLLANIVAWPLAYLVMRRWLDGFAYHIDLEPWTFLGASALALVIAMATVAGHAWLVARTQPVKALRYE